MTLTFSAGERGEVMDVLTVDVVAVEDELAVLTTLLVLLLRRGGRVEIEGVNVVMVVEGRGERGEDLVAAGAGCHREWRLVLEDVEGERVRKVEPLRFWVG